MAVLLAGATGEVGKRVLQNLILHKEKSPVFTLTRRKLIENPPVHQNLVVDFSNLTASSDCLVPKQIETAICCLGTTIKAAGSKEAFEMVDLDCVVSFAKLAKSLKIKQLIVISSVGADSNSGNFYLSTKGRMEKAITAEGFESLHIMRPGLLLGSREEFRLGECLGAFIMPLLNPILLGPLRKYRAIEMDNIADAIVSLTGLQYDHTVLENSQIMELSQK